MKFRPVILSTLLAVALLGFSGCIDLDTSVELTESGSGTVSLRYRLDNRLMELGTFDGPTDEPAVPISRRDFELAVGRVEGAEVVSHQVRRDEERTEVAVDIAFDSPDAFNALFGTDPQTLAVSDEEITIVLFDGADAPMDDALVDAFYSERTLRFTLRGPGNIDSVNRGSVVDNGRQAELVISVAAAVKSPDRLVWRIEL